MKYEFATRETSPVSPLGRRSQRLRLQSSRAIWRKESFSERQLVADCFKLLGCRFSIGHTQLDFQSLKRGEASPIRMCGLLSCSALRSNLAEVRLMRIAASRRMASAKCGGHRSCPRVATTTTCVSSTRSKTRHLCNCRRQVKSSLWCSALQHSQSSPLSTQVSTKFYESTHNYHIAAIHRVHNQQLRDIFEQTSNSITSAPNINFASLTHKACRSRLALAWHAKPQHSSDLLRWLRFASSSSWLYAWSGHVRAIAAVHVMTWFRSYLAEMSATSASYCYPHSADEVHQMLLCRVAKGRSTLSVF